MKDGILTPQDLSPGEMALLYPVLTKRELFAAMAMQGFAAREKMDLGAGENRFNSTMRLAVAYADALIAELGKEVG